MMGLSKVSHVFMTAAAIKQWQEHYRPLAISGTEYGGLPVGLCFGEHHAHLLVIHTMQFDERARSITFCLGWQTGQLLTTVDQPRYERHGLWYVRPPGNRQNLDPTAADLKRFEQDLLLLASRYENERRREGLILMTTAVWTSKSPMTVRAFIFSLDRLTCREVAVQTDPIEDAL